MRARLAVLVLALAAAGCVAIALAWSRDAPPPRPLPNRAFPGTAQGDPAPVVWAVGDGAAGRPAAAALGGRIDADRPARVLYLGDVYEHGTAVEFRDHMPEAYGPLLRRMLPTPGNHEWPNHPTGYDAFWRAVTGEATPPWYAVRLGDWTLLSLNSEAPHGAGSEQLQWLLRRLATLPTRCVLAFWHRPRFSAGRHGDQDDVAPLWDAVAGRAALVLSGHDHDLQRLRPVDGTTELVSGAGGKDHYGVDEGDGRLAFSDERADGAVRLVLHARRAELAFVATDGRRLDRASVACPPWMSDSHDSRSARHGGRGRTHPAVQAAFRSRVLAGGP